MVRRKAVYVTALLILAFGVSRAQADSFRLTVLPERPTADQPIHLILSGTTTNFCNAAFTPPVVQGHQITLSFSPSLQPVTPGCTGPWKVQFDLAPLPAGTYSVQVGEGLPLAAATFDVYPASTEIFPLLLQSRRFGVDLRWGTPSFGGIAGFSQWSDETGLFWFFDNRNVEVTVKILDGRAVNGHFWVFIASMTDLPFSLQIIDKAPPCSFAGPCPLWSYTSLGGKNANFIDVNAF